MAAWGFNSDNNTHCQLQWLRSLPPEARRAVCRDPRHPLWQEYDQFRALNPWEKTR